MFAPITAATEPRVSTRRIAHQNFVTNTTSTIMNAIPSATRPSRKVSVPQHPSSGFMVPPRRAEVFGAFRHAAAGAEVTLPHGHICLVQVRHVGRNGQDPL